MIEVLSHLPPSVYGVIIAIISAIGIFFYGKKQGKNSKQLEFDEAAIKHNEQIRIIKVKEATTVAEQKKIIDEQFDKLESKDPIPKEDVADLIFNRPKD